jgi:Flp pilus assembly protein CpaB
LSYGSCVRRLLILGCGVVIGAAGVRVISAVRDHPQIVDDQGDGPFVVVSDQDIPAGASFNKLIADGDLHLVMVPNNLIVPNALTEVSQLRGQIAWAPIYQNEQIVVARVGTRDFCRGVKPGEVCN